jgi:tRNA(Ile)-lysidine synthase
MAKKHDLKQSVLEFIHRNDLFPAGQKVLVAVSGGPDSVCLLHILFGLRQELDIDLHVAHLNHCLRGGESDVDAAYVTALAKKLRLPVTVASRDVKAYRDENNLSLEEAAREVRYDFLAGVAGKVSAVRVAVGHTADDHIETVLMHLLRGSGTRGLRGLLPVVLRVAPANTVTIVRPLLEINRRETLAYCRAHRLRPRTDTSNFSPGPFRNRVRRFLLPELRKYNPAVDEALRRTAAIAADDLVFIDATADRWFSEIVHAEKGIVLIDKKAFASQPVALQRSLLRRSIASLLGDLKDIEAGHVNEALKALAKPAGKVIELPFGLRFTIEHERYVLSLPGATLCPFPPLENEINLKIPGKTRLMGWRVSAALVVPSSVKIRKASRLSLTACFDFSRTGDRLIVHPYRTGDCFQPLGLASIKKLNRFMIDARVPRAWRGRIPIVASPEQIIWVVGYRIDERVKVDDATTQVLRLEFKHLPPVPPS